MSTFDLYSEYYDLLYHDKDYSGEVDYILSLIGMFNHGARTVLDLGCGTGKHASLLRAAGHEVSGVDFSAAMLQKAKSQYPTIPFHHGDARTVRLGKKFDVVTSLFHVASYQTSNTDFTDYLLTAKAHLAQNGIFIFDFWYGPGVLTDPPAVRAKRLQNQKLKILRIAEPTLQSSKNVVNVHYHVFAARDGSIVTQEIVEDHQMRYFFQPELRYFLDQNALVMRGIYGWMTDQEPDTASWNACVVASAK